MQFIIAKYQSGSFHLQVFNRGFQIATHNSVSKRYLRRVIRGYKSAMVTNPNHAAHGQPTHVIWA